MKPAKDMKDTLRYKHMVARLSSLPIYKKEASLMQEIAKGRQWRIDAAMEAIDSEKYGWKQGYIRSMGPANLLKQAAMFGRLKTMEQLCKRFGFEVPEEERGFTCHEPAVTAFQLATLHGHFRVADYLYKACNAGPDYQTRDWVPSSIACALDEKDIRKVDYLLKKGGDAGHALRLAISAPDADMNIVRHLVEDRKADVNAAAEGFWTPFLQAVKYGHNEIAKYLLEKGAMPQNDKSKGEAMYTAVDRNNVEMVRVMMGLGIRPDSQDLGRALFSKAYDAATVVVTEGGVDINGKDCGTLVYAIRSLTPDAVKFCLDHGADVQKTIECVKANTEWQRREATAWQEMLAQLETLKPQASAAAPAPKPPQP